MRLREMMSSITLSSLIAGRARLTIHLVKQGRNMKISIQFLTHFFGNTKQDTSSRERFNWASADVDLQVVSSGATELVLSDGRFEVFAYDGDYWVMIEETNEICRDNRGSYGSSWYGETKTKGVKNFIKEAQRQFAWNAFAFKFLERIPAGFAYTSNPETLKNYRPGDDIEWDETPVIVERVRRYYEQNLVIMDDIVYCRIEPPRYVREGRIFTPFGGFGDPVIDFAKAVPKTDLIRDWFDRGWRARGDSKLFFNPIPEREDDALARRTRALFYDVFSQKAWFRTNGATLSGRRGAAFQKLKDLWLARYESINDDVLDEASELMFVLASGDDQRKMIEEWIDRPIGVISAMAF
jgi:hypothetical protein